MTRCAERAAAGRPDGGTRWPALLIVEDEALLASHIQQLLEAFGFAVIAVASSGHEALLLAGAARPDLALIDLTLAGSMDGAETAHELRRRFGVPAIFLGTAGPAPPSDALGQVEKPLRPSQLFNAVQQALARLRRG